MKKHEIEQRFAEQYPRLFKRVYGYLALRITNRAEAEDVTSETFFKAYANLEQYREEHGSLEQWTVGIAKHTLIDHFRRRKPVCDLEAIAELPEVSPSPLQDRIDARRAAATINASLTPDHHLLLTLRHVDGYTHADIAAMLGKTEAAVRKAVSRLEQHLREQYPHLVA